MCWLVVRVLFLTQILCSIVLAQPLEHALAADDECTTGFGAVDFCGLEALQLRGQRAGHEVQSVDCPYIGRPLVADEGGELKVITSMSEQSCGETCDSTPGCHSFTLGIAGSSSDNCYLKTRRVSASDPTSEDAWRKARFRTFYKLECRARPILGYIERSLVANEGVGVGDRSDSTPAECSRYCDRTASCHSFSFSFGGNDKDTCYLKSRMVTANDPATTDAWNIKTYRSYYKIRATRTSKDYGQFSECNWAALIESPRSCTQAAEELGYGTYRSQLVPPEKGSLPPGCFWSSGVEGLGYGLFFNHFGLATFGKQQDASTFQVLKGEQIDMLCKKRTYFQAPPGVLCKTGRGIDDRKECERASELLGKGQVYDLPLHAQLDTMPGCFESSDPLTVGVWFNKPPFSRATGAPQTLQFICRLFSPKH